MSLQFDRNAWHARLNRFTFHYEPYGRISLCPYFWLTVLAVILAPFVALGRLLREHWPSISDEGREKIGLGVVVAACVWCFGAMSVGDYLFFRSHFSEALLVNIIVAAVIAAIFGIAIFAAWYAEHHIPQPKAARPAPPPKPPKVKKVKVRRERQPSLLWAWLMSKKEKVCPYIEWKDS